MAYCIILMSIVHVHDQLIVSMANTWTNLGSTLPGSEDYSMWSLLQKRNVRLLNRKKKKNLEVTDKDGKDGRKSKRDMKKCGYYSVPVQGVNKLYIFRLVWVCNSQITRMFPFTVQYRKRNFLFWLFLTFITLFRTFPLEIKLALWMCQCCS